MRAKDFITKHTSPSGVKTNMSPTDDDYNINYGKDGSVAKFRKAQGFDVKTGAKSINEWTDPGPPCVHCGLPHGGHRVAFKRKNSNLRFINPDDEVQDLDIVGAEDHEFEPSKNYTPLSQDEAELVGYSVLSGSHPVDIYKRINRARQQISRVGKGAGQLHSVNEVSKDYGERYRALAEIEKIRNNPAIKNWDQFTPEHYRRVVELSKITGRAMRMSGTSTVSSSTVGWFIDRMKEAILDKQRKTGKLPDFTGRANTARDMAKQLAVYTNGRYEARLARTWTTGYGQRSKDPSDFVVYTDEQSLNDALAWAESKGKKVHYREGSSVRTAIQIGRYVIQPATSIRGVFSDNPETTYAVSVRSASALNQGTRSRVDISDQQAAALKDIADTKNANAMQMIQAMVNVLQGEQDIKQIIDRSQKITPRDKAKLDAIIAGAKNFKEPQ